MPEAVDVDTGLCLKPEKLCGLGKASVEDERLQFDPISEGQESGESGVAWTPHRNNDGVHEEVAEFVRVQRDGDPLFTEEGAGDVG